MRPAVTLPSSIVEKLAKFGSHVRMNISRQKRPSSGKYSPKSVTYSDARTEFARAASDFESFFVVPPKYEIGAELRRNRTVFSGL